MQRDKNRQYSELLSAARKKLEPCQARSIAERAGITYDEELNIWRFKSFGKEMVISCADCSTKTKTNMWQHLTVLQYLSAADGALPSEEWIAMAELPEGGLIRGASFDREINAIIAEKIGCHSSEQITEASAHLGGKLRENARADLSFEFSFMPRYPMLFNFWHADEEFTASGKVLINAGVRQCLGTEAAGTAAVVLIKMLAEELNAYPVKSPARQ